MLLVLVRTAAVGAHFEEVAREVLEDGVEREVQQARVLVGAVVLEVEEALEVVVRAQVLELLRLAHHRHAHHLPGALGHQRLQLQALLRSDPPHST